MLPVLGPALETVTQAVLWGKRGAGSKGRQMRVAVLGAGIIGVTTAYELAKDGHDVSVIEKLPEAAAETSFANAGLFSPGHSYTWASPRAPRVLWRSLFHEGQALRFKPSLDPNLWTWSWQFLQNCTAEKARINTQRKVRLCLYSQAQLHQVVQETGIQYDAGSGGLLYLYRSPQSFERGIATSAILTNEGLTLQPISAAEAARKDPALSPVQDKFAGALYCPSDESGDCRMFTQNLARLCEARYNVKFFFNREIVGFETQAGRVSAINTAAGPIKADAFVICLGVFSPPLARQLGVRLPIYPIKGYSLTIPIEAHHTPPTLGGVDEDNLVAYSRLGDRLRVTATAEFSGYDKSHRPSDFTHMVSAIRELFPNGAAYQQPLAWAGLRPMTPEGTPIFGAGRYGNVFFNTGHGHIGWTMSTGSARITADLVAQRKPALDLVGMTIAA
jgi:D-amino-acid dehydrogenase